MLPRVRFEVSKIVNHFCHLSVLYAENLPSELADGMLGHKAYQEQHAGLRLEEILHEFRRARRIPASSWYSFARTLMETGKLEEVETGVRVIGGLEVILRLLRESPRDFDEIWDRTRVRVEDYKDRFEAIWSPKSDEVLSSLSSLAKREWVADEIRVHFVDCLWGGFAWIDSIAFTPFPDMEVQKKFLAHELSELITPRSVVEGRLLEAGLDAEITHTVVDMPTSASKTSLQNPSSRIQRGEE